MCSVGGGATFYVKGTRFNPTPGNNFLFICPHQANVLGVNDVFLIFESVALDSEALMPVNIVVLNSQTSQKKNFICNTDCHIYYQWC